MTFRREAIMDRSNQKDFFLCPDHPVQRRYEALRAIVIEERPLKDVAEEFGVSYGTVRNWHSQFLQDRRDGNPPPFS
jgi:transposase